MAEHRDQKYEVLLKFLSDTKQQALKRHEEAVAPPEGLSDDKIFEAYTHEGKWMHDQITPYLENLVNNTLSRVINDAVAKIDRSLAENTCRLDALDASVLNLKSKGKDLSHKLDSSDQNSLTLRDGIKKVAEKFALSSKSVVDDFEKIGLGLSAFSFVSTMASFDMSQSPSLQPVLLHPATAINAMALSIGVAGIVGRWIRLNKLS